MKRKIMFAVIAMVVSLSGIIILQLYWINGAIKVRAAQFDGQVLDALNDVTGKIQLREAMIILPKIIPGFDNQQRQHVDSFFNRRIAQHRLHHDFGPHDRRFMQIVENPFKTGPLLKKDSNIPVSRLKNHHTLPPPIMPERMNPERDADDSLMGDSARTLMLKATLYGRAFRRMITNYISANRDIHQRLNKKVIDSLLQSELRCRGINIPYEAAVINMDNRKLDFVSPSADTAMLRNSAYKAEIFPEDFQPQAYFLTVYFPDKQFFVLKSIGLILPGSFLFMLIIVVSCGYTIYMLLKQKKLSEMKNDFINNMTHEFKTPIATISLATDAMVDPRIIDNKEKLKRYALMIKEENSRMNLQVQNVLNAAIMDKGDFKLKMVPFDAEATIGKLIDRFHLQITERQGRLIWSPRATHYEIYGDEVHFGNVVNNLLDNASKYSPEAPIIDVRAYNEGNCLVIEVEDRGAGMSKDTQKKVFDKFYRLSTGNVHDVKGFGLGLSYAKAVVMALRGTIEVKSELKKGSVFIIKIPVWVGTEPNN